MITIPRDNGNRRSASKPRSIVRLDGREIWFNAWAVELNSANQADSFSLDLPFRITRKEGHSALLNTPETPSDLLVKSDMFVEIYVGYPSNPERYQASDLTRVMYGYADTVDIRCSAMGESVNVTGRNMVAPFLDNKISEKFANQTSSQIASLLAEKRLLTGQVTPTDTLIGAYSNQDSTELAQDMCEWDLLSYLAEQEGFLLQVRDNTLYFGPNDADEAGNTVCNYTWGQNIEEFRISRQPHATKNIVVEVHSYSQGQAGHVHATAKRNAPSPSNNTTDYVEKRFVTGMTQDQAQRFADMLLNQLAMLELTGSMSVSGNERIRTGSKIALYGVGQVMSDFYFVQKVSHKFDYASGFRTELTFSNMLNGGS